MNIRPFGNVNIPSNGGNHGKISDLEEALILRALSMLEVEENIEEAEENSLTLSLWVEDLDGEDILMRQIIVIKRFSNGL